MSELETRLRSLGDELAWPRTPDLAGGVRAQIAAEPAAMRRRRGQRLRPALAPALIALALAVVALGTVVAASSEVRATLGDWLGIGSVEVKRVPRLPAVDRSTPGLGLRRQTTLAAAQRALGARVGEVAALGSPDLVYVDRSLPGAAVSLVYRARPGLPDAGSGVGALLTQTRGKPVPHLRKLVPPDVPIERLDVRGAPGLWIGGAHAVLIEDARHTIHEQRARLAGTTLVWERDGMTYRLETNLGRDAAARLALSVR